MKLNNILYLFVLILTLSNFSNAVDVISGEDQCLINIASNFGDPKLNVPNIVSTFCSLGSSYGSCYSNGSIQALTITSTSVSSISSANINCFPLLTSFAAINVTVSQDILKINTNKNLKKLKFICLNNLQFDFEITSLDSLEIGNSYGQTMTVSPFALKNVLVFSSKTNINLVPGNTNPGYINNYTTTYTGYSDNIPDLTNMIKVKSIGMSLSSTFNETSFVNFKTYTKVLDSISITGEVTIRFPHEMANGIPRNYIYFGNKGFTAPSSPIDLSGIPYVGMFIILKMGDSFNYQGNFPFSKLPAKSGNIQFHDGNTPNVDWIVFENCTGPMLKNLKIATPLPTRNPFGSLVTAFDVNTNQVTGSIDDSWCSIDLIVNNNLLTGKIPNCFYCYLNIYPTKNNFQQNNFDNYDTVNNTCGSDIIVPYIYYNKSTTLLTLQGKNLGWVQTNLKSSVCTIVRSGDVFIVVGCPSGNYNTNVTFINQNLTFTLSLDRTEPIINSVIQSNNTLTIDGSYFSYEPSIMKIKIGNTPLNCQITNTSAHSTFYSIQCNIEYPVVEYGPKNVTVQVNSLISKPYGINLDYTKFPCPVSDCNGNGICNDHIGVCECFKDWTTINPDVCTIPIHYLSSYSQTSDTDGGIIYLYGFFGNVHNSYKVLIDGIQCSIEAAPTSSVFVISVNPGKIGTNSSIEIQLNGLSFHGTIYPYANLIKECPSSCNDHGKCNTTTGECTCDNGFTGVDCIAVANNTLPTITSAITNVGTVFRSEQTVFAASLYSFIEVDYTGTIIKYVTINSWKTQTIDQGVKYTGNPSNDNSTTFEIKLLKVTKNQQFSFAGNDFNIGAGGVKMSITVSNYTYSNQSNYLVVAIQAKAESDSSATSQNKCNDGTIEIKSQSNSNVTLNNYNYFTISKDGKRLSIRLQDRLISDNQQTYMVNKLSFQLPDTTLIFGMSLPHCGQQCSVDGPDFIVNIESNYKNASSCIPPTQSPKPTESPTSEPSFSLKESSISFSLLIVSILISLLLN
ncbi:hypothetical protein ACTA71_011738 [Dictyostelium dimigraforme]